MDPSLEQVKQWVRATKTFFTVKDGVDLAKD